MTAARHHDKRYVHHPGLQHLPEILRGDDILRVLGADRQPEGRELVVDRHPGDVVARRVDELEAGMAAEDEIGRASCRERVCLYV